MKIAQKSENGGNGKNGENELMNGLINGLMNGYAAGRVSTPPRELIPGRSQAGNEDVL